MEFQHKTQLFSARLNGKLSCHWLIMLVTMATPISSHMKDKNSIFTARDEDMIFSKRRNPGKSDYIMRACDFS